MQGSGTKFVVGLEQAIPESILEGVPLGIALVDAQGTVVQINHRALDLLSVESLDELDRRVARAEYVLLDSQRRPAAANELHERLFPRQPQSEREYLVVCAGPLERSIVVSATPHDARHSLVVFRDITQQRQHDSLQAARDGLFACAEKRPLREFLTLALDEAECLTGSLIGFFHLLDTDETSLSLQAWSTATVAHFCKASAKGRHCDIADAGVWVDCVRKRQPVVHNDYDARARKRGLPVGHSPLLRELTVPVLRSGRIVAVVGVGNKPRPYTDSDVQALQQLADGIWDIAERKRAEQQLNQANATLAGSLNAVVVTDASFAINYLNPAFVRLFHLTDDRRDLGHSLLQFWQEPVLARQVFQEMLVQGWSTGELFGKRADGTTFLVEFTGSCIRGEQPHQLLGLFATFIDISDYHRVQSGLRDAEEKFAGSFHVIRDSVHITEIQTGKLLEVNEGFERMTGYSRQEALGRTASDLHIWCDLRDMHSLFEQLTRQGHVHAYQARMLTKDARMLWGEHSAEFLQLSGRRCMVTISRDITAQRASADALEESEQRFRSMFDLHDAPMLLIEPVSAAIRCANGAAERYFGVESGALIDRRLYELCTSPQAYTTRLLDATTHGSTKSFQLQHRDLNGELREAEVYASPIHHLGHTLLFAILHDTTEHRRLEDQIRRVQRMDCLGNLASGVAHDINNVLSAILAHATVQRDISPSGSQLADDLDTITQACIRGRTLVRSLLDFARPTLAEQKVLSLNALVQEEVRLLSRTTLNRTLLKLELDPNLAPIQGDASALGHALMNLCINAVDAMPEGGTLTIATRNLADTQVQLEVRDTGVGMSPEVLEKATDPFFSTKPQGKGTGLGLPMVYSAAEAHAAQFEIESQTGRGTRVRLTFPTLNAPIEEAPESGSVPWTPSALSILAVDDDWIVLRGLARQLTRLGHHVTPCTKGTEALSQLDNSGKFDLVVLDVNMPELGGCDLLTCSRKAGHDYPVLFVTGRPDEALQQFIVDHPGTAMLAKPFTQGELQTAIRRLCGSSPGWSITPPAPFARLRTTPHLDAGE